MAIVTMTYTLKDGAALDVFKIDGQFFDINASEGSCVVDDDLPKHIARYRINGPAGASMAWEIKQDGVLLKKASLTVSFGQPEANGYRNFTLAGA